jgi:hypothetical protein
VPFVLDTLENRVNPNEEVWVVGFLLRIFEKGFTRLFLDISAKTAYVTVVETFLQTDRLCEYIHCPVDLAGNLREPLIITPTDLAQFFSNLVNFELYEQLVRLVYNITIRIHDVPGQAEYQHFWLPFLHELLATLRTSFIPVPVMQYRPMFRAILTTYAEKYAGGGGSLLRNEIARFDQGKLQDLLSPETFDSLIRLCEPEQLRSPDEQLIADQLIASTLSTIKRRAEGHASGGRDDDAVSDCTASSSY